MKKIIGCKICKGVRVSYSTEPLCKKCLSLKRKEKYLLNKDKISLLGKLSREKNKDKIKQRGIIYRRNNKEQIKTRRNPSTWKNWVKKNPDYKKNRWKIDQNYRIKENLRGRLYKALVGFTKSKSSEKLLGCTVEFLKIHLEKQFTAGMSWDNYGEWHVDHIKPCAIFDFSKTEEQEKCFHYTNLQPLWAKDNLTKSKKYEELKIS